MTGLGSNTISLGKLAAPGKNAQAQTIDAKVISLAPQDEVLGTREDAKVVSLVREELEVAA